MPDRSRRPRVATLLVAAVVAIAPGIAAQTPVTREAFSRELDALITAVADSDADGLDTLAARVPSTAIVTDGEGAIEVSYTFVLDQIREAHSAPGSWTARRDRLVRRLQVMRDEVDQSAAPDSITRARAALAGVLARREFGRNALAVAADRLRERVSAWITRTWDRLVGRRRGTRSAALVLAWVVTVLALAALASLIVRSILATQHASRLGVSPPPAERKPSRAWAREALAATEPRDAVRCLYNAAICRLEEEGAWRADDTRTPREYVRLLPPGHARRTIVQDVAALFEDVWYRARPAAPDDTRRVAQELEVLGCVRSGRVI